MKTFFYQKKPAFLLLICLAGWFTSCSKKEKSYHQDGTVSQFQYNDPNGVNVVILGDGFVHDDLVVDGIYDTDVRQLVNYFFSVSPYKEYASHFNVYAVYAESQQRGASSGLSITGRTKFSTYFDLNITRLLVTGDYDAVEKYVQYAVPSAKANLVIVLVNDDTYGGSGGPMAVISTNVLSRQIMIHEVGHTFGYLGDEYVEEDEAQYYPLSLMGGYANVDSTANLNQIKWKEFLPYHAYRNVGAYQGAFLRNSLYRPEQNSVMLDLSYVRYNAPSREAIVKHIDQIIGVPFDLNAFLKADSVTTAALFPLPPIGQNYQAIKPPSHDFIRVSGRHRFGY